MIILNLDCVNVNVKEIMDIEQSASSKLSAGDKIS